MKVSELIEQLKKCNPEADVVMITSNASNPRYVEWVRDVSSHKPGVAQSRSVELRGI